MGRNLKESSVCQSKSELLIKRTVIDPVSIINGSANPQKPPLSIKKPFLLRHLNSKNLERGYKLGDGTSGKVYLVTDATSSKHPQKTYALKQIKLKVHKIIDSNNPGKKIPQSKIPANPEEA